jgi:putative tryptophan/tyrosine transport system substrate-binding protein
LQGMRELGYVEGRGFDITRGSDGYQDRLPALAEELVHGIQPYVAGLPAKQMELAREIVPRAINVGVLTNLQDPKAPPQAQELEAAARTLGIKIVPSDVSRPDEIESALEVLASRRVDIVVVLQTSMLVGKTQQIAKSALAKRLPTVYGYRDHVIAGGLISYGVDLRWCFHRAAYFVDKILRGAAPGDLPVEFPTNTKPLSV